MIYDVVIIGAGVSGAAIARELSRYEAEICVLEKEEDVCCGTSKANSAIVHAGYDCKPGTMMARMNLRGNEMMEQLSEDLDFPFRRNGSFVVCLDETRLEALKELYEQGIANGVPGLRMLDREEALQMEPNLSENTVAALYAPSAGIVCPFGLNIAMAENAKENGVDFFFNTKTEEIHVDADGIWHLRTNNGEYRAKCVVNAAGVYADQLHNMVSKEKIHITARRGDYLLLDHEAAEHVSHTIFPQPTALGKGVLVAPTVHGNLLVAFPYGREALSVERPGESERGHGLVDTQPRGLHTASKKFDIYSMRGKTDADDAALMKFINKDMEDLLFVDDTGAVFDVNDNYVANCIEGDPGDGICC